MEQIKYVFDEIVKLKDEEPEGLEEMHENEVNRMIEEEHEEFDEPGHVEQEHEDERFI